MKKTDLTTNSPADWPDPHSPPPEEHREPLPDEAELDDDWEGLDPDPMRDEIWEPGEFDGEETLPEHGDFWPELDDPET